MDVVDVDVVDVVDVDVVDVDVGADVDADVGVGADVGADVVDVVDVKVAVDPPILSLLLQMPTEFRTKPSRHEHVILLEAIHCSFSGHL